MLKLYNFGRESVDQQVFNNICDFRGELNQLYNTLRPFQDWAWSFVLGFARQNE
jgi:hypothetical protein